MRVFGYRNKFCMEKLMKSLVQQNVNRKVFILGGFTVIVKIILPDFCLIFYLKVRKFCCLFCLFTKIFFQLLKNSLVATF